MHRPFLELVRQAQSLGLLDAQGTADQHAKQSKNQGLPHLEQALDQLEARLKEAEQVPEQAALRLSLTELQRRISKVKQMLGAQSDHLEIVRRGAETHLDLNPATSISSARSKALCGPRVPATPRCPASQGDAEVMDPD